MLAEAEGDADADDEADAAVLGGRKVGRLRDGGRVIVGRNDEVSVASATVMRISPMSSCVIAPFASGRYVMVSVVSSDSTRLTMATRPAAELTRVETVLEAELTVKLALAFDAAEVDM